MAAQCIPDIHSICFDPASTYEMTPVQYQQGSTSDISAYIQFTFWKKPFLYLNYEADWPASKEKSAR